MCAKCNYTSCYTHSTPSTSIVNQVLHVEEFSNIMTTNTAVLYGQLELDLTKIMFSYKI